MAVTFSHFLLLPSIFESLQIFTKLFQTFEKSPTQSLLIKKLTLGDQRHVLMLLHSLLDFSCIAFRDFICGIFGDLATDHNASKSFETLHMSPNHSLLMRKLSLLYS